MGCLAEYYIVGYHNYYFVEVLPAILAEACSDSNCCGEYYYQMDELEETCYVAYCQRLVYSDRQRKPS